MEKRITKNEFATLCAFNGVHIRVALENKRIVEAIKCHVGLVELQEIFEKEF